MSDDWTHLIMQLVTAIVAIVAAILAKSNSARIEVLKQQTDGLTEKLVAQAARAGKAEGKEEAHREGNGGASPVP